VQGARQLKAKIPEAVTVFILAPSRLVLEQRLRARSEDREDVIARRIREAAEEIRRYEDYNYVLINRELAEAEATLSAIVRRALPGEPESKTRSGPFWTHFKFKVTTYG
jgi:guanylate kinase